jgi:hypothetical protein
MQDARGRARPKIEQICADLRRDLMGRHQKILISADHTTKKMLQEAVEACASRVEACASSAASAACLLQIRNNPTHLISGISEMAKLTAVPHTKTPLECEILVCGSLSGSGVYLQPRESFPEEGSGQQVLLALLVQKYLLY